jgi:porin
MVYSETGVTPKWKSAKGPMPGNVRFGVWYDPTPKTKYEDTGTAEVQSGDVGYYIGADQLVWKESATKDTQGLGMFARYGHAHADRNRISDYWSVGASYKGLIPERDRDVTGLAVSQSILSDRYADERNSRADRETAYELYYAYEATPWCIISPHFQVITNPAATRMTATRSSAVCG